ncbi:putative lipoyltransferase 2, mitochondrial [Pygocentrus nattereri]|uniref:Octanoyl-[acyl-carrier-protein]:protein N-octanoyltransferase LIPT2, mitochondrial n=1 Tax=Pygocentrus nattereri TaxID=42514 RepID=A0AAR2KQC0_PYGNA|nr:putative lipoyltransferase 2, mitochondrial [Pygocentrus nattereri]XP_017552231.1 putative lipoyltransferase 2, mitochondrial [Pygocentrus nattereri]XP_017552232.1 putative lipoyltransferase 2, mitochondrial [Pygocentrus nattereri]XP_017552233.1 putative lipoyltransferase 2, mitochondrial [Pygocentrus nattereri]XP_017552234.1 putative lipoyltransferase 2, mitochondrial [Pygocentrus nattereri]XP_017552235.1 putative lipoyltransferase 2, mitochondrial [Pygocentrus nattereri]XP_037402441.1 pu
MSLGKTPVRVVHLGRIAYRSALQIQQHYIKQHFDSSSQIPNTLLLCEHYPVYTVGIRRAQYPAEEEQRLKDLGADFFRANRGGLITFHGPGQLVCYPILNLGCFKKSVRWYVCELERTVIEMCGKFRIKASTSPDTGVWVGNNKICAIGIHCGRYVTSHGLALNCNTDLSWFENIVPCGIVGKGVTSLSQELGRDVMIEEATPVLLEAFSEQFSCTLTEAQSFSDHTQQTVH